MKHTLTWWDLIWFGIGAVIGAGIFVLTGQEAKEAAGPAVVVSYAVSGVSAMLSVFCYTEFAVEIPVAGTSSIIFHMHIRSTMMTVSRSISSLITCALFVLHSSIEEDDEINLKV